MNIRKYLSHKDLRSMFNPLSSLSLGYPYLSLGLLLDIYRYP